MKKIYSIYIVIVVSIIIGIVGYVVTNNQGNSEVYLEIICNEENLSGMYKEGEKINCNLLGNMFEIEVEDISNDKIKLTSSDYGLFPESEEGGISLIEKCKKFELYKGKKLVLVLQATDAYSAITFLWK